jgi:hypothetical protein
MPTLLELQRAVSRGLRAGDADTAAEWIVDGPIAAADRLRIHRNTMLGALTGALRLTFPAIDALVGAEFFDQAARAFILAAPPVSPWLGLYGAEFPEFLEDYAPAAALPYLADVGRLEWAVEQAAATHEEPAPAIEIALPGALIALAPSLRLLRTEFPAEPIWRAVLDGDESALDRIDPSPAATMLAIWREGDGAGVAPLGPVAATFLNTLLAGAGPDAALLAAAGADPSGDPIAAIAAEILPARFTHVTPTEIGDLE